MVMTAGIDSDWRVLLVYAVARQAAAVAQDYSILPDSFYRLRQLSQILRQLILLLILHAVHC